jgi:hypothetical protein
MPYVDSPATRKYLQHNLLVNAIIPNKKMAWPCACLLIYGSACFLTIGFSAGVERIFSCFAGEFNRENPLQQAIIQSVLYITHRH